ncbi:MAG: RNA methyltransferase, partial [Methanobrevibacter sp.]|nr:RNA methyltransferase [Methanobrevibacter sp.]
MTKETVIVKDDNTVLEEKEEKNSENKTKTKTTASSTKRGKKLSIIEGMKFSKDQNLLEDNIFIVFVECESPGNIGFLARVMANF